MRVAIYVRVSTEDQHPENQIMELREFAKNNGWEITNEYVDRISGSKESRPSLDKLMTASRNKEFDAVLVWKLDRLGRSLQHLLQIIQEWDKRGINFICKTQNIDTTSASGKLIFSIMGAIAEFERELIRERINLGLKERKRRGKPMGRPKGSKDKKRRNLSGYWLRWAGERKPK